MDDDPMNPTGTDGVPAPGDGDSESVIIDDPMTEEGVGGQARMQPRVKEEEVDDAVSEIGDSMLEAPSPAIRSHLVEAGEEEHRLLLVAIESPASEGGDVETGGTVEAPARPGLTGMGDSQAGGGAGVGGVTGPVPAPGALLARADCLSQGERPGAPQKRPTSVRTNDGWTMVKSRRRERDVMGVVDIHRGLFVRKIRPEPGVGVPAPPNGTTKFAPLDFSDPKSIRSPAENDPFVRVQKVKEIRELVTLEDIINFRIATFEQVQRNIIRERKVVKPRGTGLDEKNAIPVVVNGVRPMLYRMTPHFKGKFRFLDSVHYETFTDGRPDLRVIQLDNFAENLDGRQIDPSEYTTGDLFWVYQVSISSHKALQEIKSGLVNVNAFLEEKNAFSQWNVEVVVPLPVVKPSTRLCLVRARVANQKVAVVVYGNPEDCTIYDGQLVRGTYLLAQVRQNEGGWVFPVEPVLEEALLWYSKNVRKVRPMYTTMGPFVISAVPIDENYRKRLKDRTESFEDYSLDPVSSRKLLSESVALGVAYRALKDTRLRKLETEVRVLGLKCDLPNPVEITLEVGYLSLQIDEIEKISLHRGEKQPKVNTILPKAVELVSGKRNTSRVIGTVTAEAAASLLRFVHNEGLNAEDFCITYMATITPKSLVLDIIAATTASHDVAEQREGSHIDRLYGRVPAKDVGEPPAAPVEVRGVDGGTITLNEKQSLAVVEVVEREREALIVESPPGSGKTLMAAVMAALVDNEKKVVAVTVTNSAAKNLADAVARVELREGKSATRMTSVFSLKKFRTEDKSTIDFTEQLPGALADVRDDPESFIGEKEKATRYLKLLTTLRALEREIPETSGPERVMKLDEYHNTEFELKKTYEKVVGIGMSRLKINLIVSTVDHAVGSVFQLVEGGPDVLIIDEASQVTEAQLLCLIRMAPKASLVLVGDSHQLNPYRYEVNDEQNLAGRSALFIAGMKGGFAEVCLDMVYRAPPSLTALYSESFYGGALVPVRTDNPAQRGILTSALLAPEGVAQYRLVDTEGTKTEKNVALSLKNDEEARLVLDAVKRLRRSGIRDSDILVICLYVYQQCVVRSIFAAHKIAVDVLTVDSAQGRERRVVLLLTTRTSGGRATFFDDPKRVNVAISRQREALIVFGCAQFLETNESWRTFIRLARSNGSIQQDLIYPHPNDVVEEQNWGRGRGRNRAGRAHDRQ